MRTSALIRATKLGAGRAVASVGLDLPLFRLRERRRARRAPPIPAVGHDGLPLPPAELQVLVMPYADPRFAEWGVDAAASIRALADRTGPPLEALDSVLDFGVGCGRIARHWAGLHGPALHACDYNPALVAWCRDNLPFLRTIRNGLEPPLPYRDAEFDFVYAWSVFTHMDVDLQHRWVAELTRVLTPGGRLVFSTHGASTSDAIDPRLRPRFDAGECVVHFASAAGSNLCAAFHPVAWVRETLVPHLEVLEVVEGGMPGLPGQDMYVARRHMG